MDKKKKVFALILNWNSASDCIVLYDQLKSTIQEHTISLKVWVIDNDSKIKDQEELKQHLPQESLIFTGRNLGYAGGNNVGIRKAMEEGADYLVILNPDIRIDSDFINPLLKILEENPDIGVIGPRINFRDRPDTIFSDGGMIEPENKYYTYHHNCQVVESEAKSARKDVGYVNGSAMVIPTATISKFGLFREKFFLYFEETEWCLRVKNGGSRVVVCPSVKVWQELSNNGKIFHYYMNRNRLWVAKLHNKYYKETFLHDLGINFKNLLNSEPHSWAALNGTLHGMFFSPKEN